MRFWAPLVLYHQQQGAPIIRKPGGPLTKGGGDYTGTPGGDLFLRGGKNYAPRGLNQPE